MWEPIPGWTLAAVLVGTWLVYTLLFVLMEAAVDLLVDAARWAKAIAKAAWREEPVQRPVALDPHWTSSMHEPVTMPIMTRRPQG